MADSEYLYDPEEDRRRQTRKRQLAQTLLQASVRPREHLIDAGAFKVKNWAGAIDKVANAWAAGRAEKDLDEDERKTTADQAAYTARQTAAYQEARKGGKTYYAGDDTRALDQQGEGATPDPVLGKTAPNPARAMALAIQSKIPSLLKTAQDDDKEDLKLLTAPGFTPESRQRARLYGDPSLLQGEPKEQVINGQLFRDGKPVLDARNKFGPVEQIPGAAPGTLGQTETTGTGEVKRVTPQPGVTVQTGDRMGVAAFNERVKAFGDRLPLLDNDNILAENLAQALPMIDKAQTGFGAEALTTIHKIAKTLGLSDDQASKITNSETLRMSLAPMVFSKIKNLGTGTGVSNTDLQFAREATLGQLQTDDRAMKNAIRIMILETRAKNVSHNDELAKAMTAFPDQERVLMMYNKPWSLNISDPKYGADFQQGPDGKWSAKLEGYTPRDPSQPAAPTPAGPSQQEPKPAGWSNDKWQRYLKWKELNP